MGNSDPKIDQNKECIIWLDQNVFNDENKATYKFYKFFLSNFNFLCFTSVDSLFSFIIKKKNYFEFRLFYIVVSGSLAEEYFSKYVKNSEKYNILAASIVYCLHPIYHEMKPYFEDKFLNSGGVTCDFETVKNYILKDECNWKKIHQTYKEYKPEKAKFGDVFMLIDTRKEYELGLNYIEAQTAIASITTNLESSLSSLLNSSATQWTIPYLIIYEGETKEEYDKYYDVYNFIVANASFTKDYYQLVEYVSSKIVNMYTSMYAAKSKAALDATNEYIDSNYSSTSASSTNDKVMEMWDDVINEVDKYTLEDGTTLKTSIMNDTVAQNGNEIYIGSKAGIPYGFDEVKKGY